MYADTHCHLNHADFDVDGEAVRARAWNAGVTRLLCIGYDEPSSRRAVDLARDTAGLSAAIGLHPDSAGDWNSDTAARLSALFMGNPTCVAAWGEIGLDYHWNTFPPARQQHVFAAQIAHARSLSSTLPLIIHCRDAQDDVLAVLRESGTPAPVVMHCFTGDWSAAQPCLEAGYFLGIGGVATFKKSEALRDVILRAPLDRLLLETDCPYLAPQPWRGKRNEPSYLPAVAQTVAAVKSLPLEMVAETTTATACSLFGWH